MGEYLYGASFFPHYDQGDGIAGDAFEHSQQEYPFRPFCKKLIMKLMFSNK